MRSKVALILLTWALAVPSFGIGKFLWSRPNEEYFFEGCAGGKILLRKGNTDRDSTRIVLDLRTGKQLLSVKARYANLVQGKYLIAYGNGEFPVQSVTAYDLRTLKQFPTIPVSGLEGSGTMWNGRLYLPLSKLTVYDLKTGLAVDVGGRCAPRTSTALTATKDAIYWTSSGVLTRRPLNALTTGTSRYGVASRVTLTDRGLFTGYSFLDSSPKMNPTPVLLHEGHASVRESPGRYLNGIVVVRSTTKKEYLNYSATHLVGYRAADQKVLWSLPYSANQFEPVGRFVAMMSYQDGKPRRVELRSLTTGKLAGYLPKDVRGALFTDGRTLLVADADKMVAFAVP